MPSPTSPTPGGGDERRAARDRELQRAFRSPTGELAGAARRELSPEGRRPDRDRGRDRQRQVAEHAVGARAHPRGPSGAPAGAYASAGSSCPIEDERAMRAIRGWRISMVFQDCAGALNPVFTMGRQLTDVCRLQHGASRGGGDDSWRSTSSPGSTFRAGAARSPISARILRRNGASA